MAAGKQEPTHLPARIHTQPPPRAPRAFQACALHSHVALCPSSAGCPHNHILEGPDFTRKAFQSGGFQCQEYLLCSKGLPCWHLCRPKLLLREREGFPW